MRHPKPFFAAAIVLLPLLGLGSCSSQGEGGRCDTRNGNSDCDSGLVCTPAANLVQIQGNVLPADSAICCPPLGQPTSRVCTPNSSGGPPQPVDGGADASSRAGAPGAGGASGAPAGGTAGSGTGGAPSPGGAGARGARDAGRG